MMRFGSSCNPTFPETSALCQSIGVSRAPSPRALVPAERRAVRDTLHSARFVDQSPAEVYAPLLEEQTYLCSPRTMYRVLAAADEVRERRDQVRHPAYVKPELVAGVATKRDHVALSCSGIGRHRSWTYVDQKF